MINNLLNLFSKTGGYFRFFARGTYTYKFIFNGEVKTGKLIIVK